MSTLIQLLAACIKLHTSVFYLPPENNRFKQFRSWLALVLQDHGNIVSVTLCPTYYSNEEPIQQTNQNNSQYCNLSNFSNTNLFPRRVFPCEVQLEIPIHIHIQQLTTSPVQNKCQELSSQAKPTVRYGSESFSSQNSFRFSFILGRSQNESHIIKLGQYHIYTCIYGTVSCRRPISRTNADRSSDMHVSNFTRLD